MLSNWLRDMSTRSREIYRHWLLISHWALDIYELRLRLCPSPRPLFVRTIRALWPLIWKACIPGLTVHDSGRYLKRSDTLKFKYILQLHVLWATWKISDNVSSVTHKPKPSTVESCLCKSEQLLSRTGQVGHPRVKVGEPQVGGLPRPVS